jgi:hypothetical protein
MAFVRVRTLLMVCAQVCARRAQAVLSFVRIPAADHLYECGRPGQPLEPLNPWDWPPDCPTHQIWLHERCEGPWWDCGGQPQGGR